MFITDEGFLVLGSRVFPRIKLTKTKKFQFINYEKCNVNNIRFPIGSGRFDRNLAALFESYSR